MATKSWYYLFDLPEKLVSSLQPFSSPLSLGDVIEPSSLNHPGDSESSESSEDESQGSEDEIASDNAEKDKSSDLYRRQEGSSTYNTQYLDIDEEANLLWEREHLSHVKGSPYVLFSSPELPDSQVLKIFKGWFNQQDALERPVAAVRNELLNTEADGISAILLVGGGHFAGAIIRHHRGNHRSANISNPFASIEVIESKTFHRYTTRRKQGGAQSASDNAHGKANSAGSTIRRANEQLLKEDVHALLQSWSSYISKCHRIWVHASGRSNRGLIMGYPGAAIATTDRRVQNIPFATGRATYDECRRAWLQLTRAIVGEKPEMEPPKPVKSATPVAERSSKSIKDSEATVLTPEEKAQQKAQRQAAKIVDLVKRSRLSQLKQFFEDNKLSWDWYLQPNSRFSANPTALLYAAANNKHHVVTAMLQWGADPTIIASTGATVGDLAKVHPKVLDALQISRSELGESRWDWNKARVGPPLSKEDVVARDLQEKARIREKNDRESKEQEAREKNEKIEDLISKPGRGRMTGGAYQATRGLSESELRHVERERRARAAEARLALHQGKK